MSTQTLLQHIRKIPQEKLHVSKPTWWLNARFHFSFADYYNPNNMNFGNLRVLNDDLIQPKSGFGKHPHKNFEIFTYVVDGAIYHEDSMGFKEALSRGCVQYLSAGTGIWHAETNEGDEVLRSLQFWVSPDRNGHKPQYGSKKHTKDDRYNKFLHLLGGTKPIPSWFNGLKSNIKLHQDINVFVSETEPNFVQNFTIDKNRQLYIVCIEGDIQIYNIQLSARDALEIETTPKDQVVLEFKSGGEGSHYIIVDMGHIQMPFP